MRAAILAFSASFRRQGAHHAYVVTVDHVPTDTCRDTASAVRAAWVRRAERPDSSVEITRKASKK